MNFVRHEKEIELGGKTYKLRPSFAGLVEMESRAGAGLMSIATRFSSGSYGFREVVAVIFGGLVGAGDRSLKYDEVGQLIAEMGLNKVAPIATDIVATALRGAPVVEEDKKSAGESAPDLRPAS